MHLTLALRGWAALCYISLIAVALPGGPRNGCYLHPDKSQTSHTCPVHGHPTPCQVSVAGGPALARNSFQRRVALCVALSVLPSAVSPRNWRSHSESAQSQTLKFGGSPETSPSEALQSPKFFLCVGAMFLLKMWRKCAVLSLFGWGAR